MSGLLEQVEWEGRVYSGGWTKGSGGRLEVSDKATDEVLAVVGAASPGDVRRVALSAEIVDVFQHRDDVRTDVVHVGYKARRLQAAGDRCPFPFAPSPASRRTGATSRTTNGSETNTVAITIPAGA